MNRRKFFSTLSGAIVATALSLEHPLKKPARFLGKRFTIDVPRTMREFDAIAAHPSNAIDMAKINLIYQRVSFSLHRED